MLDCTVSYGYTGTGRRDRGQQESVRYSTVQTYTAQTLSETVARDAKEEQILDAAREAFLELGYTGTSMDHVAQRARVSKTTLYNHFSSKEALFGAVIKAECEGLGMAFDPVELMGLSAEEALNRIGRAFLHLIYSPAAIRMERIVTGEAARFPEVAAIFYREGPGRVIAAVTAYMTAARAHGLLDCEDPAFAAGQYLMAMKGTTHCQLVMGVAEPPDDINAFVARAVRLLLDGLRPRS